MRVSEITLPSSSNNFSPPGFHWSDVKLLFSFISLTLRQSKTDSFQEGQRITITATNTSTCLVRALHCYANLIPLANQSGPLFNGGRFAPLSWVQVTSAICQLLQGTGIIQSDYSSHSFHIGAATTAGLPATLIKALDCWKSNTYETYVQFPPSSLCPVSSILALTDISTQAAWNPDDPIP